MINWINTGIYSDTHADSINKSIIGGNNTLHLDSVKKAFVKSLLFSTKQKIKKTSSISEKIALIQDVEELKKSILDIETPEELLRLHNSCIPFYVSKRHYFDEAEKIRKLVLKDM